MRHADPLQCLLWLSDAKPGADASACEPPVVDCNNARISTMAMRQVHCGVGSRGRRCIAVGAHTTAHNRGRNVLVLLRPVNTVVVIDGKHATQRNCTHDGARASCSPHISDADSHFACDLRSFEVHTSAKVQQSGPTHVSHVGLLNWTRPVLIVLPETHASHSQPVCNTHNFNLLLYIGNCSAVSSASPA